MDATHPDGVLVAMLPVADLAVSARFYARLLRLEVLREFVQDGRVTGCSLGRPGAGYALSLRLRDTLAAPADLRGEHPIIWRLGDRAALERFHRHAEEQGFAPALRRHDDADLVVVVDPDGVDVLVGLPRRDWDAFEGYELTTDGYQRSHDRPLLDVG